MPDTIILTIQSCFIGFLIALYLFLNNRIGNLESHLLDLLKDINEANREKTIIILQQQKEICLLREDYAAIPRLDAIIQKLQNERPQ